MPNIFKEAGVKNLLADNPRDERVICKLLTSLSKLADGFKPIDENDFSAIFIHIKVKIAEIFADYKSNRALIDKIYSSCLQIFKNYLNSRDCTNVNRYQRVALRIFGLTLPQRFIYKIEAKPWLQKLNVLLDSVNEQAKHENYLAERRNYHQQITRNRSSTAIITSLLTTVLLANSVINVFAISSDKLSRQKHELNTQDWFDSLWKIFIFGVGIDWSLGWFLKKILKVKLTANRADWGQTTFPTLTLYYLMNWLECSDRAAVILPFHWGPLAMVDLRNVEKNIYEIFSGYLSNGALFLPTILKLFITPSSSLVDNLTLFCVPGSVIAAFILDYLKRTDPRNNDEKLDPLRPIEPDLFKAFETIFNDKLDAQKWAILLMESFKFIFNRLNVKVIDPALMVLCTMIFFDQMHFFKHSNIGIYNVFRSIQRTAGIWNAKILYLLIHDVNNEYLHHKLFDEAPYVFIEIFFNVMCLAHQYKLKCEYPEVLASYNASVRKNELAEQKALEVEFNKTIQQRQLADEKMRKEKLKQKLLKKLNISVDNKNEEDNEVTLSPKLVVVEQQSDAANASATQRNKI